MRKTGPTLGVPLAGPSDTAAYSVTAFVNNSFGALQNTANVAVDAAGRFAYVADAGNNAGARARRSPTVTDGACAAQRGFV